MKLGKEPRLSVGNSHARVGRDKVETAYLEKVMARIGAVVCWRFAWDFDAAIQVQG